MCERPPQAGQGPGGTLFALGAVLLAVACCAGSALLAAGGLALVGGVLANPLVLAAGAVVLAGAVLYTLRRRARTRERAMEAGAAGPATWPGAAADDCCAPASSGWPSPTPATRRGRGSRYGRGAD